MSFLAVLRDVVSRPEDVTHNLKPFSHHHRNVSDITFNRPKKETRPVVELTVEEVRPDITAVNAMSIAVQEMATCKGMFDKWAQELDRGTPAKSKREELEDELFAAVDELRDEAACALDASGTILQQHEMFAHEMSVLLESTSAHPTGDFYRPMEVMAVGDTIMQQSDLLCAHSERMKERLDFVLELVDRIRTKQERRTLWKKILKWLVKAFNVLAAVLTVGAFVLPIVHPIGVVGTVVLGVGATLATAAATLCRELEASKDHEQNFELMIDFLKNKVPAEAEKAKNSLRTFQAAHQVLKIDMKMKNGECVRISKYDADRAREEWRAHRLSWKQLNTAFQRSRDGHDY